MARSRAALVTERSPLQLIAKRDPSRLVAAFDKIRDRGVRKTLVSLVERIAKLQGA
jgi:hypothetical protein